MALGALAGGGLGYYYDKALDPTEGEVAVLNSGSLIGTTAGLMLGAAIDPPRGDAYSLNMTLGSMAGIGAGLYFRDYFEGVSATRMMHVNLGAMAGAAVPWILVYPAISSDDGDEHQLVGFLSTLTMAGGAYVTWRWTEDGDSDDITPEPTSAPALVQRSDSGGWRLSTPLPRPMQNPALAPPNGASVGADLLSGRF